MILPTLLLFLQITVPGPRLGGSGDGTPLANECATLFQYGSYTQEQKNQTTQLVCTLIFKAGQELQQCPTLKIFPNEEGVEVAEVCVPGTHLDLPTVVNDSTVLAEYDIWKADQDQKTAEAQAKEAEALQEVATNPLCQGNIGDVAEKVLAEDNIQEALIKLARCMAAFELLK